MKKWHVSRTGSREVPRHAVPDAEVCSQCADVADDQSVRTFVQETIERFAAIDALVNNAGIEGKQDPTEDYRAEEFH